MYATLISVRDKWSQRLFGWYIKFLSVFNIAVNRLMYKSSCEFSSPHVVMCFSHATY